MRVEVRQDEVRPELPRPDAGLAVLLSLVVALLITIGEIDHLLSQVLDDGRTWSVTRLTGVTSLLHPGETSDGSETKDRRLSVTCQTTRRPGVSPVTR